MRTGCRRIRDSNRESARSALSRASSFSATPLIGVASIEALNFVATLMDTEVFAISDSLLGVRTADALYWSRAT